MKTMLLLLLAGSCGLVWAQTNLPAQKSSDQEVGVHSDHFFYENKTRELVYYDNVVATNWQGQLTCARLAILMPADGGHPTNIVAETNVVIDFMQGGDTNHITSDKAIYVYGVVNGVTNETITLTGHARGENSSKLMTGEPLVWDNIAERFFGTDFKTILKPTSKGNGTNASPFNLLK
jgi:lipopolysaccharide export system protein LptA